MMKARRSAGADAVATRPVLGINQGEVSKIEHRSDIRVRKPADYVEAIGGRLEIRAVKGGQSHLLSGAYAESADKIR